eukprot:553745-Alexandrium_andersonii.AAC.1
MREATEKQRQCEAHSCSRLRCPWCRVMWPCAGPTTRVMRAGGPSARPPADPHARTHART